MIASLVWISVTSKVHKWMFASLKEPKQSLWEGFISPLDILHRQTINPTNLLFPSTFFYVMILSYATLRESWELSELFIFIGKLWHHSLKILGLLRFVWIFVISTYFYWQNCKDSQTILRTSPNALWETNRNSCFQKLSRPSKCVKFNVGYLLT